MVCTRTVFTECDSMERTKNVARRNAEYSRVPIFSSFRIWLFDFPEQSFSLFAFPRRRHVSKNVLARDWHFDVRALVSRQSWRLAIFLSLRHYSAAVDVSAARRKWAA